MNTDVDGQKRDHELEKEEKSETQEEIGSNILQGQGERELGRRSDHGCHVLPRSQEPVQKIPYGFGKA
jgi:hypothetical protein